MFGRQTDIFGRNTGEINGSDYTPWYKSYGVGTFNSLYSRVYSVASTLKKSLKLHRHRKNVHNRLQIMNPLKKANVRYFNNDRTYYGSERNMHNMTHLQRSCIDIFKNEMIIMLNDTWANKKTAQDMDIGSAMHQKLHQMHSNRLIEVPKRYKELVEFIYTVGDIGALNTGEKRKKQKRISGNLRKMFNMDIAEEYYRTTKRNSYPLQYGKCPDEDCIHIPLSAFHQIKKFFLDTVCNVKDYGINNSLVKAWFNHKASYRENILQSEGSLDKQEMSGKLLAVIQEEILHMLEDVYIDEQLAKSSPGYVKYLMKFKKSIAKNDNWIETEMKSYDFQLGEIMRGYIVYVTSNLYAPPKPGDPETSSLSISDLKEVLDPLRELMSLISATIMMKFIVYLPELINKSMEYHINFTKAGIKELKRGLFRGRDEGSPLSCLVDMFEPIDPNLLEKHMKAYSSIVTDAGSRLFEDDNAVVDTSELMYEYFYQELCVIKKAGKSYDHVNLSKAIDEASRSITKDAFSKSDRSHTKGISKRMRKELNNHDSNNTEEKYTRDPGIGSSTEGTGKHKLIVDHYQNGDLTKYNNLKSELKAEINALRKRISLYGLDKHIVIRNLNRGSLDRKSLYKIPTNRVNLFKKEYVDHEPEMNIGILMDQSGSMASDIDKVRDTAIVLYEAMKDNPLCNLYLYGHSADMRGESVSTHIFEYLNGPSLTNTESHSNNRDGVAIYESANLMMEQIKAKNNMHNMLIVLCDGAPAAAQYYPAVENTAKSIKHVQNSGIKVACIGMGYYAKEDQISEMNDNYTMIETIEDIKETLPKTIKQTLKI